MAADLSELTGKKKGVVLNDGKEYVFKVLTIADWAELEGWMKSEPIERARKLVEGRGDDSSIVEKLLMKAYEDVDKIFLGSSSFIRYLTSIEGIKRMAYLSLRQSYNVTPEQTASLVDWSCLDAVKETLDYVNLTGARRGESEKAREGHQSR